MILSTIGLGLQFLSALGKGRFGRTLGFFVLVLVVLVFVLVVLVVVLVVQKALCKRCIVFLVVVIVFLLNAVLFSIVVLLLVLSGVFLLLLTVVVSIHLLGRIGRSIHGILIIHFFQLLVIIQI